MILLVAVLSTFVTAAIGEVNESKKIMEAWEKSKKKVEELKALLEYEVKVQQMWLSVRAALTLKMGALQLDVMIKAAEEDIKSIENEKTKKKDEMTKALKIFSDTITSPGGGATTP